MGCLKNFGYKKTLVKTIFKKRDSKHSIGLQLPGSFKMQLYLLPLFLVFGRYVFCRLLGDFEARPPPALLIITALKQHLSHPES